jgi:hypothetical protein
MKYGLHKALKGMFHAIYNCFNMKSGRKEGGGLTIRWANVRDGKGY